MNITFNAVKLYQSHYQNEKINNTSASNSLNLHSGIGVAKLASNKLLGLSKDTVSFGTGAKMMACRADSVNIKLARQIHKEAKPAMDNLQKVLKKYLNSLIATETNPNRPILSRNGIVTRIKSEESICEKTAARALRNKDEIKDDLGDIIGARIVLRDASEKNVDEIIKHLIEAVKNNDLKIFEIENYRPSPKYSYVSNKSLNALEKTCSKMRTNGVRRSESSIPSGYTALHLGVYLPDGYIGEVQLMGADVQKVKEIEDMIYKVKNNKSLGKKYKIIEDALSQLKDNKPLQRAVNTHSMEQYIQARTTEPHPLKSKKSYKFLPVPNYLPPEFDYNLLYKMKLHCDK